MKKVSVILPTYNEAGNIIDLIKQILKISKENNLGTEIIVVDDDSPDNTSSIVVKHFKNNKFVKVFNRKNSRGLAKSIRYGISKATGDIIIGMDADLNHDPTIIPSIIEALKTSDLVVASRFIKKGGMSSRSRYIYSYIFNKILKLMLGFPIRDNTSGMYGITKKSLMSLPVDYIYQGYGEYHLRLVFIANKQFKITEVPIIYGKRNYGKSKSNLIYMFFSYLYVGTKLRFTKIIV